MLDIVVLEPTGIVAEAADPTPKLDDADARNAEELDEEEEEEEDEEGAGDCRMFK